MSAILIFFAVQVATTPLRAQDIVVRGKRLSEASEECQRGGCSARRDAQVSIALAEQQFRIGDYASAKNTLAAAVSRNRSRVATDPRPVAALYEAYATVSVHGGDLERYRSAMSERVRIVREHLPQGDKAVAAAEFNMADVWMRLGRASMADKVLATAEQRLLSEGQTRSASVATLKRAAIATALKDQEKANRLLDAVDRASANDPDLSRAAQIVRLRLAVREPDQAMVDSMVASVRANASARPLLLWAPPYGEDARAAAQREFVRFNGVDPAGNRNYEPLRWVDVGFWVKPDGHTGDIEVLRGSRSRAWVVPLLEQVAGRRYTAVGAADGLGTYRIERFTWRATLKKPIGQLVRMPSGPPSLEVLDLADPAQVVIETG